MPAGTDLLDWSPRKGSTGDDRYDLDTTGDYRWVGGDSSGFTAKPTLSELALSSGLNQVIGEINRRNGLYADCRATAYTAQTYVTPVAGRVKAADFTACRTAIDTIRARENSSVWSWPTTPITGGLILEQELFNLRKALATDRFCIHVRDYLPMQYGWITYPPEAAGVFSAPAHGSPNPTQFAIGQNALSGPDYEAYRVIYTFILPSYLPTIAANGNFIVTMGYSSVATAYDPTVEIWRGDNYLTSPATAGIWDSFMSHGLSPIATQTFTSGMTTAVRTLPLTVSSFFVAGTNVSLYAMETSEINNSGHGAPSWGQTVNMVGDFGSAASNIAGFLELYT